MATVNTAVELEQRYGALVRPLVCEHSSGYALSRALGELDPPLVASVKVCRTLLRDNLRYIENAGHLELHYGDCNSEY